MDFPALVVISITAIAVAILCWTLARGGHPENECRHNDFARVSENKQFYLRSDRHAAPDAEDAAFERDPPPPGRNAARRRWHARKRVAW